MTPTQKKATYNEGKDYFTLYNVIDYMSRRNITDPYKCSHAMIRRMIKAKTVKRIGNGLYKKIKPTNS